MTVEETLWMYGRLRGLKEADIKDVIERLLTSLLLEEHSRKETAALRCEPYCNNIQMKSLGCSSVIDKYFLLHIYSLTPVVAFKATKWVYKIVFASVSLSVRPRSLNQISKSI